MFWRISKIAAILIFFASVTQLYREPNIGYLVAVLSTFISLMTWLKGPVVLAAEKLDEPNMEEVQKSINSLAGINNWLSRWELSRAMRFHQNPIVRTKAIIALVEIGDERAIKRTITYSSSPDIQNALSKILKIKSNKRIRNFLVQRFKDLSQNTGMHTELKPELILSLLAITRRLEKTQDKEVENSLIKLFALIEGAIGFGYGDVEREIINALAEIGSETSKEFLVQLFKGEWVSPSAKNNQAKPKVEERYYRTLCYALRRLLTNSEFKRLAETTGYGMHLVADNQSQENQPIF